MTGRLGAAKKAGKRPVRPMGGAKAPMSKIKLVLQPRIRELKFSIHLMSKSVTSIAGVVLLAILVFVAAFPWLLAPPEPGKNPFIIQQDFSDPEPRPPGDHGFLLGSGDNGKDIYYGIIWGARISMAFAIQVVGISLIIGTLVGLVAGYKGGVIDEIMMRTTDIFLSIPGLILVMAIAAVLERNLTSTKIALLVVWWAGYTRLVRGQVLATRENTYVDAARAAGSGELKIMFRHVLPNSWTPVIVQGTMDMGTVVLVLAGLGFLGLGAPLGYAEWGRMVSEGQAFVVVGYWWMTVFPGLAILFFVLAFNLMGDGLRDVLDPKMRR